MPQPEPLQNPPPLNTGIVLAGVLAVLFGLATLMSGGASVFGPRAEGTVLFVLYFNFSSGFLYILTGLATLFRQRWALLLARLLVIFILLIFVAFGGHVMLGGAYMTKTVGAMSLRTTFWLVQAAVLARYFR